MSNDLDLGRDNHVELVQIRTKIKTGATIKRQRMLVVGDSTLRGTQVTICHLNNFSRKA